MRTNPNCNSNRRDKVALRTICNKNINFNIIKIRRSYRHVVYLAPLLVFDPPSGFWPPLLLNPGDGPARKLNKTNFRE